MSIFQSDARCHQENLVEQLKNGAPPPGQHNADTHKADRAAEVADEVLALQPETRPCKGWSLDKLHAVREGKPLYQEITELVGAEHPAALHLYEALMQISCGYFEYDPPRKAACYSDARHRASRAAMALHLTPDTSSRAVLLERLEQKMLPAIGGLVRQAERRKPRR